jgi:magnesium-dependent phosphatase 1
MGVTSILVGDGVNLGALRQGLSEFSQNASKSEKNKQRWQKYSQNPNSSEKKDED